ncbi:hypothetical protein DIK88_16805 [Salmonella enterica]|nr:hypothetical protein [Salmonella enterica]EBL7773679.1 hypothetical protein [Salmonella enterica]
MHGSRRTAVLQKIHCLSKKKQAVIENNNRNTLQAFTKALESEYGFVISPTLNNRDNKPLTQREAKKIDSEVRGLNVLKKLSVKPENVSEQRLAFWPSESIPGSIRFIDESGMAKVVDSVAKIKEKCSEDFLRFVELKSAYCNLNFCFDKENLQTFIHAIYEFIAKCKDMSLVQALVTLLDMKVGEPKISFEKLTTLDINKCNKMMVELKPIISEFGKLLDATVFSGKRICAPVFETIPYSDMTVEPRTQARLKDGTPLAVNMLSYNNKNVALARSYPMKDGLQNHFKMLMEQNCKHLVVLTPQNEMDKKGDAFYNYFSSGGEYGDISISVKKELSNEKENRYKMTLQNKMDGTTRCLDVIHVNDWKDKDIIDVNHLISLASELNLDGVPPAIHCLGGVGRTGTLAVAMQMLRSNNTALTEEYIDSIIEKFRQDRNGHMVQGPQRQLLTEMARTIKNAQTFPSYKHEYVNISGWNSKL